MSSRVTWSGSDNVQRRIAEYGLKAKAAAVALAAYFAPILETYAKENAPWEDRTGNARQTLHAFVEELANDIVVLYLSGGVNYQIWLEIRWAGKYAIIWPTIEAHLPKVRTMLQELFS